MVDLTKNYLFPTPVYQVCLDDSELLNVYLKSRLYSWRQRGRSGLASSTRGNMGVWQSVDTMHEMQEFQLFNQQIRSRMDAVLQDQKECLSDSLWCLAMCANISDRFGYDQPMPETGYENGWQGIYFVQTPGDCGSIEFQNPRNCKACDEAKPAFKHQVTVYDAVAGRLLLFPSWLKYEIQPNRSKHGGEEGERISIRFVFGATEPGSL